MKEKQKHFIRVEHEADDMSRQLLFQLPAKTGVYPTEYGDVRLVMGKTDGKGFTKTVFESEVTSRPNSQRRIVRMFQDKETHQDRSVGDKLIFRKVSGKRNISVERR